MVRRLRWGVAAAGVGGSGAEMFGQGYVGTSQDVVRIRKQEKQREEAKKKYEELQKAQRDKVNSAGLRQYTASKAEVRRRIQAQRRMCVCVCVCDMIHKSGLMGLANH